MMNTETLLEFASNTQKPEAYKLIDQTIQGINDGWCPYSLEQIKKDFPLMWEKIICLEETINGAALQDNTQDLIKTLGEYRKLMLSLDRQ